MVVFMPQVNLPFRGARQLQPNHSVLVHRNGYVIWLPVSLTDWEQASVPFQLSSRGAGLHAENGR